MVKRSTDQKLQLRNSGARHGRIEIRSRGQESKGDLVALREEKEFAYQWKANCQCSRRDQCSFRHERNDRAKPTPKAAPPSEPPTPRGRRGSRKRNVRGKSQTCKFNRQPCKYFLKGTCTNLPCEYWHPPECQFYMSESVCEFGTECSFPYWKVEEQPNKKRKKGWWQKCSMYCEKCATFELCVAGRRAAATCIDWFYGRAQKSWDLIDEYDSRKLHCVMLTSEKIKVRRSEKSKSKFIISAVRTLWHLRIGLRRRLKDGSDVPAETRGYWSRLS